MRIIIHFQFDVGFFHIPANDAAANLVYIGIFPRIIIRSDAVSEKNNGRRVAIKSTAVFLNHENCRNIVPVSQLPFIFPCESRFSAFYLPLLYYHVTNGSCFNYLPPHRLEMLQVSLCEA